MFQTKTWVNRQSEHPVRRKLAPTSEENVYDVTRAEGTIMEDGDAFDASNMNGLEQRIADGFSEYDPDDKGVDVTIQTYTCVKSGKTYALTGKGAIGRCKIPASWNSGDEWTVNGESAQAHCGGRAIDADVITAGRWVFFIYEDQQLFFFGTVGVSALTKTVQGVSNPYYATLKVSDWTALTGENDLKWQQTATLTCPNKSAPTVTADSVFLSGVGFDPTGVADTDDTLADVLEIINKGRTVTTNGGVLVKVREKPTASITARWTIQV